MGEVRTFIIDNQSVLLTFVIVAAIAAVLYFYTRSQKNASGREARAGSDAERSETVYNRVEKSPVGRLKGAGIIVLIVVGIILVLYVNGVNVLAGLAGIGIATTIIGLALQDYLKDTIMGIRIFSDGYFGTGDVIRINGITGVVIGLTLRSTKIENVEDHSIYSIRNGEITSVERLSNLLDIMIPFPYDATNADSEKAVKEICGRVWLTGDVENCYYKGIYEFGESSISYKLRCFCKPESHPDMRLKIHRIIREVFEERGIEIPFNQLDVHMK